MTVSLSAILLAGGMSRRMGRDKALLRVDETTLLERNVRVLASIAGEVLVVGRDALPCDLPAVRALKDFHPGCGPLGGIVTGLEAARADHALVVAVDLPFLRPAALSAPVAHLNSHDAVVPVVGGRAQPLHALYARKALPALTAALEEGEFSLGAILERMNVFWLPETELARHDPDLLSCTNVNTPEEWEAVLRYHRLRSC